MKAISLKPRYEEMKEEPTHKILHEYHASLVGAFKKGGNTTSVGFGPNEHDETIPPRYSLIFAITGEEIGTLSFDNVPDFAYKIMSGVDKTTSLLLDIVEKNVNGQGSVVVIILYDEKRIEFPIV